MTDRASFAPASPVSGIVGARPAPRGRWTLSGILSVFRQRHRLAELEPHMLKDIGLTAGEAHREASRPIWDVPKNWRA
jgi:hypothetical protein